MDHPAFDPTPRAIRAAGLCAGERQAGPARKAAWKSRLLGGAAAALLAMSAVSLPTLAHAQNTNGPITNGPIVIPGPGEKDPAALADLAKKMQTAAPVTHAGSAASLAAATAQSMTPGPVARNADAFTRAANASGSIVIPGAGEPAAAPAMIHTAFKPDANGVVTIPAPASAVTAGVPRINLAPGSRQAVPVVVNPAPITQNTGRAMPALQPVAANPPAAGANNNSDSNSGGFDSLSSRGEPPQLGANGQPVKTAAVPMPARPAPVARMPMVRTVTPAVAPVVVQANVPAVAAAAQQTVLPGQQDPEAIHSAALAFLQQQAAGLPGKVELSVAPAFPHGLAACTALEPFMPTGARLWGRTTVGVRCVGERPWTLYLQAHVSLHATYYLAAREMAQGEVLTAADLVARDGDLTGLPQAVVTDPAQAVGYASLTRISAGLPLRRDMLKSASSVSIGQTVKVVAAGAGFSISAEGSVMNNAAPGQQVRVKTANGQIISGILKDGSTVEIQL